jgi:hypothetical protein
MRSHAVSTADILSRLALFALFGFAAMGGLKMRAGGAKALRAPSRSR